MCSVSIFGCCLECISLPCNLVALCLVFSMAAFNCEYTSIYIIVYTKMGRDLMYLILLAIWSGFGKKPVSLKHIFKSLHSGLSVSYRCHSLEQIQSSSTYWMYTFAFKPMMFLLWLISLNKP